MGGAAITDGASKQSWEGQPSSTSGKKKRRTSLLDRARRAMSMERGFSKPEPKEPEDDEVPELVLKGSIGSFKRTNFGHSSSRKVLGNNSKMGSASVSALSAETSQERKDEFY